MKEWLDENIIEETPEAGTSEAHYLPHRPVSKESSTTKIRPVFDASAREKQRPSLNQCLEKGLNLIEEIPNILLRFRTNKIGVISDIKKAFLQISVHEDDRKDKKISTKPANETTASKTATTKTILSEQSTKNSIATC